MLKWIAFLLSLNFVLALYDVFGRRVRLEELDQEVEELHTLVQKLMDHMGY